MIEVMITFMKLFSLSFERKIIPCKVRLVVMFDKQRFALATLAYLQKMYVYGYPVRYQAVIFSYFAVLCSHFSESNCIGIFQVSLKCNDNDNIL